MSGYEDRGAQTTYTVPLSEVIKELSLRPVYMPADPEKLLISSREMNRPGLELNGFLDYFDSHRILIMGSMETASSSSFSPEERQVPLNKLLSKKSPAVIAARDIEPMPELLEAAQIYGVSVFGSSEPINDLMAALAPCVNVELAPRITRHGVLVEIYGEGIFLVGDSGVGKSETVIELIKRGHRLIADDAVETHRVSAKSLAGVSPENIRRSIELRGIGIINAWRIFGIGAAKVTEKIDMVTSLGQWDSSRNYDRMGLENDCAEILEIRVPILTIPVKPGYNLAVIIEVAAMNNHQKKMGCNAAQELLNSLGLDSKMLEPAEEKLGFDLWCRNG